jgi:MFS family permease
MLAYVFSYLDRQIMSLLIEPIRADLRINDTQFGLLHGVAFSLFYAVIGIPIAVLSDRRSRPMLIALGVAFWSLATALCGVARHFTHLLLARFAVGAGEAVLTPAAYSLLADLFPREKLGRAVAVYSVGSFVGAGLALLLGGAVIAAVSKSPTVSIAMIGELRPWQLTFIIVGLAGIPLALLIAAIMRDPGRRETQQEYSAGEISVWRFLAQHKAVFTAHYFGYSMSAMALYSLLSWSPAYLIRNFGLSSQEAGYVLGLVVMSGCTSGVLTSGWLMDALQRRGYLDAPMRTGVIGVAGLLLPSLTLPFATRLSPELAFPVAITIMSVGFFFAAFPMPPSTAAMQILAPNRLRARVSAVFLFFNSLLGLALGSLLIGSITDYVFNDPRAVGTSMCIVVFGSAVAAVVTLGIGCRLFRESLQPR